MSLEAWTAIDQYLEAHVLAHDTALEDTLSASAAAGLPPIAVSPTHGALLALLVNIHGARSILEIGTLGGYSAIWMARALLPGGHLVTLESDSKHAELARANLKQAGVSGVVTVREGLALETLPKLLAENMGPFDFFFVDADKENNAAYFDWALKLSRKGSVIVVDNVVRDGRVLDEESRDASVQGVRRFLERVKNEPRVNATAVQTVGRKGHDGFLLARVER